MDRQCKWVKVLKYSECSITGKRIITYKFKFWKLLLAELNTHRAFSRNAASSRAVPSKKMRERAINDCFVPEYWGKNQKGMAAYEESENGLEAKKKWLEFRDFALIKHKEMEELGIHKQLCNRILEPFLYVDVVVTATELTNFFKLRNSVEAQPEFMRVAEEAEYLWNNTNPQILEPGEWHLPFIDELENDLTEEEKTLVSAARCARVSYYLHENGKRSDLESDKNLGKRLRKNGHLSPFEHPAQCMGFIKREGNFVGWKQYRKTLKNESGGDYIFDGHKV